MKDYSESQINHDLNDIIVDNVNLEVDSARIKLVVIGVGGGGNNAIKMILEKDFKNVDFIVANTDDQSLAMNPCKTKINLGRETRGLGAGSDPELGAKSAYDSLSEIQQHVEGADIVIVAAGFGGGTGTGAAPVIAEIAKKAGALTIGIVTTPFDYEGPKRNRIAREGLKKLANCVDSYIVISNDKLADNFGDLPVSDTFKLANITLRNIIVAFHDILYRIGDINIDFADVSKVLKNGGLAVVGIGQATGKERATKAVVNAFEQNLYEFPVKSARRILVNIQYDKKTTLTEIKTAVQKVHEMLSRNLENENEDYDCIIGQEPVETKDNAGLFKVSIIAGDAQVLSESEIKANKNTLLSNQNEKFEIVQDDVIKEQVIVYPKKQDDIVANTVLNEKFNENYSTNFVETKNQYTNSNEIKLETNANEVEVDDNSWVMSNSFDDEFDSNNKNNDSYEEVKIVSGKYNDETNLEKNIEYDEQINESKITETDLEDDYNFDYDLDDESLVSNDELEEDYAFSGAEAGTYSDETEDDIDANNVQENENQDSTTQSQNDSKESSKKDPFDWF